MPLNAGVLSVRWLVGGGRKFSKETGEMWSVWPGKENVSVLSVAHSYVGRKQHHSVVLGGKEHA